MKTVKLKDISNFQTGPFGTQFKAREYTSEGIPVLNVKNIGYGNILEDSLDHISEATRNRLSEHVVITNDIVFGRKGSVDRHAFISEKYNGWFQGSDCIRMRIHSKEVDARYVSYYLCLPNVKKQIVSASVGSTMDSLNTGILKDISITLPHISKQQKISEFLVTLDHKIENNNRINSELESMAKIIYDYWFQQFEFPNDEGKPYKSSGGKMVWNDELKREIPERWDVDKIGNHFCANRGLSYNSSSLDGNGIPMINLASFNTDGTYKYSGLKTYSGIYSNEKVLKPFDLVMCNTQQTAIDYKKDIIGRAFLVPDIFNCEVVSSHHVTTIKINNDDFKFYLHRLFNTEHFHKYVTGYTNGTNILGLIFSGVENYITEIPNNKTLHKFALTMILLEQKKSMILKENQELASLRDFLLPLLMNGQVGFKEGLFNKI